MITEKHPAEYEMAEAFKEGWMAKEAELAKRAPRAYLYTYENGLMIVRFDFSDDHAATIRPLYL